jgi:predicted metal-dependent hydrolase
MESAEYDRLYLRGIEHFNACDFYEAHEVWEELWQDEQGPSRKFYQGLIQVAVCLHHFGNGNTRGAKKLYYSSRNYLEAYRPRYLGLDVDKLIRQLEECCAGILASPDAIPRVEIDPERIPEIHLDE